MSNVALAFLLTFLAGMATAVGAALAFFVRRDSTRTLALCLAFSAGVMLYVSFTEILGKAAGAIEKAGAGPTRAAWLTAAGFFGGMLLIGLIDRLIPKAENPHEPRTLEQLADLKPDASTPGVARSLLRGARARLLRVGAFTGLAIAIHNFPEGMATFFAAVEDPAIGVALAIAIALHNIPEGVSVSVPIYYATGRRRRAFAYAAASGVAEPLGAMLGYFILAPLLNPTAIGVVFAGVAGIMVFISLDELLPTAREYSRGHETIYGMGAGMAVMALSLLLLK